MPICTTRKNVRYRLLGTTIAELPMGLWFIFIGIGMPLLCLILNTIRYGLFLEATREAADVAAQAQFYTTPTSNAPLTPSAGGSTNTGLPTAAVTLAQNQAVAVASSFSGLSINPDECAMLDCYHTFVHGWIAVEWLYICRT